MIFSLLCKSDDSGTRQATGALFYRCRRGGITMLSRPTFPVNRPSHFFCMRASLRGKQERRRPSSHTVQALGKL